MKIETDSVVGSDFMAIIDSMKDGEAVIFRTGYGIEVDIFKESKSDYRVMLNNSITIHCDGFRLEDWDEIELLMGASAEGEVYMECKNWQIIMTFAKRW